MVTKSQEHNRPETRERLCGVGEVLPGHFHPESLLVDMLVLDKSCSMEEEGFKAGMKKKEILHKAVSGYFARKLQTRQTDMVGMVLFDHDRVVPCSPSNICTGYDALIQSAGQLMKPLHGGTDMGPALLAALKDLESLGFLSRQSPFFCRVIVFSDGWTSYRQQAIGQARALHDRGVLVESLGLGQTPSDVDEELLKNVATTDEDGFTHYSFLGDSESLLTTFERMALASLTWEG